MEEFNDCQQLMRAIRAGELFPERSGEYWSAEEREKLMELFYSGVGISQIALLLQRSETAVIQQLIVGKVLTTPGVARNRRPKPPRCLCKECQFCETCTSHRVSEEGCYAGNL